MIACAIRPDATQRDVDRLDDAVPAHPNASHAHPEASTPDDVIVAKSFDVNGEPKANRTAQRETPRLSVGSRWLQHQFLNERMLRMLQSPLRPGQVRQPYQSMRYRSGPWSSA